MSPMLKTYWLIDVAKAYFNVFISDEERNEAIADTSRSYVALQAILAQSANGRTLKIDLNKSITNHNNNLQNPIPGTTRDAVDTPFERNDQKYLLIDTAGIRKKGKTWDKLEKISIIKALQSIDKSHVCILLIDASESVADQDLHIAGYIQERYRACIVGVNKWDEFSIFHTFLFSYNAA